MTPKRKATIGAGVLALVGAMAVQQEQTLQSEVTKDGVYLIEIIGKVVPLDTKFELWSTRMIPPSPPKKIGEPVKPDYDVSGFLISPDSQHVAYRLGQTAQVAGGNWRLYVVSPDGSNRVSLTPTLVQGGNVEPNFRMLPGDWIHWTADAAQDEHYQEFEASIAVAIFRDGFESGGVVKWL
jgi:hypothetical protein